MKNRALLCLLSLWLSFGQVKLALADERTMVDMPPMMQAHMLGNMRDHLMAIEEIVGNLATGDFTQASHIAENRLGMSSLKAHGASHMAKVMPKEMAEIGTAMHRSSSRFALLIQDAELTENHAEVYGALQAVLTNCNACHSAYKIR